MAAAVTTSTVTVCAAMLWIVGPAAGWTGEQVARWVGEGAQWAQVPSLSGPMLDGLRSAVGGEYAATVPVSPATALWAWLAVGALLWCGAGFRMGGARIGWAVYGAATVGLVYWDSPPRHRRPGAR
ncbi:hypothetical protein [Actinocatenispora rupis]|uniref:hypothetical protein n=1 Tax=Actinocatenispora rupis TaxID=519421 RepID=UPI001944AD29|nr:hypothetical protein [Actinocatenispora rupis]